MRVLSHTCWTFVYFTEMFVSKNFLIFWSCLFVNDYKNLFHILEISSLSDIYMAHMKLPLCRFFLLVISFIGHRFLIFKIIQFVTFQYFIYLSICWWAPKWISYLGRCEQCCDEQYLFPMLASFLSDVYPGVRPQGHLVNLFLIFWGNFIYCSV